MATLADILDALADQIRTAVSAVTDVDVQVEPRMVLDPTPPTIDMYPSDPATDFDVSAFGELLGGELITVRVRVQTADSDAGQDLLLALMDDEDPLSLIAAVNDDLTLNGTADRVDPKARTGYQLFPVPQGDGLLLGFLLYLEVLKARS